MHGNPVNVPILRGPKAGQPLNLDNLARREVPPILKDAKIEWHGWYSFLRRGIATTLHNIEKDPMAAKGLLRHSSVLTTQMHYIKEVPETTLNATMVLVVAQWEEDSARRAVPPAVLDDKPSNGQVKSRPTALVLH